MDAKVLYSVQLLAIEMSGTVYRLDQQDLPFLPIEREYLLQDERQVYNLDISVPVPEGVMLSSHVLGLSEDINDTVRAIREGARELPKGPECMGDFEKLYAEIEGEAYLAPIARNRDSLALLNGYLDLLQNLEALEDALIMYPELTDPDRLERWKRRREMLTERIEASQGIGIPGEIDES
jgi:hypothetical protein